MSKEITEDDLELLEGLGVETEAPQNGGRSVREQRIVAGFEEIEQFAQAHGRAPEHGEDRDIFERLYAVRLDRIRAAAECRELLRAMDSHRLLAVAEEVGSSRVNEEPSDEDLLTSLGMAVGPVEDVTRLIHVRSREEIKAAEEIAQRSLCEDFDLFRPVFEKVQDELVAGRRQTLKYQDNAGVRIGDLFILEGQKLLIAAMGEIFTSDYGRPDRRLRVVYDSGTESDLLVRSLQRALNKDKASRRITNPDFGLLFSDEEDEDDLPTGYIYVLRSRSDHPFVLQHQSVIHKIGVTGGDVKGRVANARKDPTYLLAEVEIMVTFKLSNINRKRIETLLHRFFGRARLDMELKDRFGAQVEPREWFLVPLPVIEDAIQKLMEGSIGDFRYDPAAAEIVARR